jgi:hypothetical protein
MAVWYFAYGSNMSPGTFGGRLGMRPIESRAAWIDGYRLCFDIPSGPASAASRNLCVDDSARTQPPTAFAAPAHRRSRRRSWDSTEGVPQRSYAREAVEIVIADGVVSGFTYRFEDDVRGS